MMLGVNFSYMLFFMLRKFPSIPTLLSVFIRKRVRRWWWSGPLAPRVVNTWLCSSRDPLQHCACVSQCTRLATGHVCPVGTCKLHVKPWGCVMVHAVARVMALLRLCLLRQLQENTACLLLRLRCQSGENEPVCSS